MNEQNITYNIKRLEERIKKADSFAKRLSSEVFERWHKNVLPEIFATEGKNISLPFRLKKNGVAGISSGNTYKALMNRTSVGSVQIINEVSPLKIRFGYDGENAGCINVSLGTTKDFIENEISFIKMKMEEYIKSQ